MINLEKLVKILNLTQSDADGEALNAIRIANQMLKAEKTSWQALLGKPATVSTPPPRQQYDPAQRRHQDQGSQRQRPPFGFSHFGDFASSWSAENLRQQRQAEFHRAESERFRRMSEELKREQELRDKQRAQAQEAPPWPQSPPKKKHTRDELVDDMFDAVLQDVAGSSSEDFINSLHDAWEKYGKLTEKQFAALQKFYENIKD